LNFFDLDFSITQPDLPGCFFTPVSGVTCYFYLHELLLMMEPGRFSGSVFGFSDSFAAVWIIQQFKILHMNGIGNSKNTHARFVGLNQKAVWIVNGNADGRL
jgi:hypothetical protein